MSVRYERKHYYWSEIYIEPFSLAEEGNRVLGGGGGGGGESKLRYRMGEVIRVFL